MIPYLIGMWEYAVGDHDLTANINKFPKPGLVHTGYWLGVTKVMEYCTVRFGIF